MSERKETPDILGSVLGGVPTEKPQRSPDIMPDSSRKKAPARRVRKKAQPKSQPGKKASPKPAPPKSAPAQSLDANQAVSVWEYRDVIFYDYGGYVTRYVEGEELPNWKRTAPPMSDFINQMGSEGWEMVGLLSPKRYHLLAIFKRRKTP